MNEKMQLRMLQQDCSAELAKFYDKMMYVAQDNGLRPIDFKDFMQSMCESLMRMAEDHEKEFLNVMPDEMAEMLKMHGGSGRLQ